MGAILIQDTNLPLLLLVLSAMPSLWPCCFCHLLLTSSLLLPFYIKNISHKHITCTASIYDFMHHLHNSVDDECIHTTQLRIQTEIGYCT